ncbi:alpha/beta fold hydrolase [Stigmatella aurantiaca]|uniref:Hydrolase n=1 Tax=Stigmatella aurantiaca (strain DW4/3-1) TaxID=378806 RepID=Q09D63_STIAD|nr:alpha/beta hydrolase [Stigmatella aurantiaca]ADO67843.1 Hydrolase, alpha/beta fold family protein [Stigmatella aurantiaca DW4/3-1]EAU69628.1 hydrolase [Stigmatella aurantiaca DW4/3-1]
MSARSRCLLLLAVLSATVAPAQERAQEPLGIAMEGYAYPYPVQFLSLTLEGQDVRMAYMDVKPPGKANGRTVLLLHGKNFFGGYWRATIQALTGAGYRVVVPDQVGFGKSSKPALPYSFHTLAAATQGLLNTLGVKETVVLGHSMGGMLATRFARLFPEATTHLVLENPIGLEDYRLYVPWQSTEALYREQLQATEEGIRKYHRTYYVTWKPEYEEYVRVPARQMLSGEYPRLAWVAAATQQMIYEQPVVYEFPLVARPTLLVIGQEDRTVVGKAKVPPELLPKLGQYPELGKKAAAAFPQATLVPLPGVGHIPHFEAPEKFHKALLDFLGK